ncbi:MAG: hypothetical protein HDS08_07510 [Bacteroides sp.]|nr:hypothetical protein [Bacteroides sp.]
MKLSWFDKICGYLRCADIRYGSADEFVVNNMLAALTIFMIFPFIDIIKYVLYPYVHNFLSKNEFVHIVLFAPLITVYIISYFTWIFHDRYEKIMEAPCFHTKKAPYIGLAIRTVPLMIILIYPWINDWVLIHVFGIDKI